MKKPAAIATTLLLVATACTSDAPDATGLDTNLREAVIDRVGVLLSERAYVCGLDFGRWPHHVAAHRDELDGAATYGELRDALDDTLAEFDVSHLWVWSPEDMRMRAEKRRAGLGFKSVAVDEGLLVTLVLPEGPAAAAGVVRGDVITHIDGTEAAARPSLGGSRGTLRRLAWLRGEERFEADLVHGDAAHAPPASLEWLEPGIAWLRVPSFSSRVYESRTIERYIGQAGAAKALVIDLRSNGGGSSDHFEHLAGLVFEPGTVVMGEVYAEDHEEFVDRFGREPSDLRELLEETRSFVRVRANASVAAYTGPLFVIIDGRSGSGAETFPAMVQDTGRGRVIGTRSAGVVISGDSSRLPGGFVLFHPTGELTRLDGSRLEGVGVDPDIRLSPVETVDDAVVHTAVVRALQAGG